jgi:allantoate deiminase
VDAAGNLRGIHGDPNQPRLMIASHLDTVPDAGAFDGVLGVVMGIALVETQPKLPIEVVGFSEEEGVRFGTPFIGSRALAGTLDLTPQMEQAIRDYGLDPADLHKRRSLRRFPHIWSFISNRVRCWIGPVCRSQWSMPLSAKAAGC